MTHPGGWVSPESSGDGDATMDDNGLNRANPSVGSDWLKLVWLHHHPTSFEFALEGLEPHLIEVVGHARTPPGLDLFEDVYGFHLRHVLEHRYYLTLKKVNNNTNKYHTT